MLIEAEMLNSRRRFGLFSQPTTLALGDNSLFPSKTGRCPATQLGKDKMESPSPCPEICWQAPIDLASARRIFCKHPVVSMLAINILTLRKSNATITKRSMENLNCTRQPSSPTHMQRHCRYLLTQRRIIVQIY
jgi:hypothetical protein